MHCKWTWSNDFVKVLPKIKIEFLPQLNTLMACVVEVCVYSGWQHVAVTAEGQPSQHCWKDLRWLCHILFIMKVNTPPIHTPAETERSEALGACYLMHWCVVCMRLWVISSLWEKITWANFYFGMHVVISQSVNQTKLAYSIKSPNCRPMGDWTWPLKFLEQKIHI